MSSPLKKPNLSRLLTVEARAESENNTYWLAVPRHCILLLRRIYRVERGNNMSNTSGPKLNPIIEKLTAAKANKTVVLAGYAGQGSSPGTIRVYGSIEDLSSSSEIAIKDIVHQHDPEDPLSPSHFFLNPEAEAVHRSDSKIAASASFFGGAISAAHLSEYGGASAAVHGDRGPTNYPYRCETSWFHCPNPRGELMLRRVSPTHVSTHCPTNIGPCPTTREPGGCI